MCRDQVELQVVTLDSEALFRFLSGTGGGQLATGETDEGQPGTRGTGTLEDAGRNQNAVTGSPLRDAGPLVTGGGGHVTDRVIGHVTAETGAGAGLPMTRRTRIERGGIAAGTRHPEERTGIGVENARKRKIINLSG